MTNNLQKCPEWCDQESRPHQIHEQTVLTMTAVTGTPGSQRPMTCQLIVAGASDRSADPVLALVDARLEQVSVRLSWEQAHRLASAVIEQYATFRRLNAPQD